jgi:hypothetical protein
MEAPIVTDETPAPAEAEKPSAVPLTTDELAARFTGLPPGTKEAKAYADLGHGWDRAAFRNVWLSKRLGVSVQPKPPEPKAEG